MHPTALLWYFVKLHLVCEEKKYSLFNRQVCLHQEPRKNMFYEISRVKKNTQPPIPPKTVEMYIFRVSYEVLKLNHM